MFISKYHVCTDPDAGFSVENVTKSGFYRLKQTGRRGGLTASLDAQWTSSASTLTDNSRDLVLGCFSPLLCKNLREVPAGGYMALKAAHYFSISRCERTVHVCFPQADKGGCSHFKGTQKRWQRYKADTSASSSPRWPSAAYRGRRWTIRFPLSSRHESHLQYHSHICYEPKTKQQFTTFWLLAH